MNIGDHVIVSSTAFPLSFSLNEECEIVGKTDKGEAYQVMSFRRHWFGRVTIWVSAYDITGRVTSYAPDGTAITNGRR